MNAMSTMPRIDRSGRIVNIDRRTTIRNLIIFTLVVLASGWIGRGVDLMMGNTGPETLGMLVWLVIPFPISLLLRAAAGDGWKDLGIRPNLKGNLVWYAAAVLVYPVVTAVMLITGGGLGLITFPNFTTGALALILQAFASGFLFQFLKNIFEEGAWRGYLAPKIHALRMNDFAAHTLVGIIWGAWHIPYYLFFLDGAVLQQFTTLNVAIYIPLTFLVYIAWAWVFGEIRLLTNSLWPALLMHSIEDAFLFPLFQDRLIEIVPGTDWLISPMNGLLNVFLFIAIGVGLRQLRKRRMAAVIRQGAVPAAASFSDRKTAADGPVNK